VGAQLVVYPGQFLAAMFFSELSVGSPPCEGIPGLYRAFWESAAASEYRGAFLSASFAAVREWRCNAAWWMPGGWWWAPVSGERQCLWLVPARLRVLLLLQPFMVRGIDGSLRERR